MHNYYYMWLHVNTGSWNVVEHIKTVFVLVVWLVLKWCVISLKDHTVVCRSVSVCGYSWVCWQMPCQRQLFPVQVQTRP